MAKAPKAERKLPKLPKSLGACVDIYHDFREKRLGIEKEAKEVKADETYVADYLIENISKRDEGGAVGKRFKAVVKTDVVYQIDDWPKFYAHIQKTGAFELLNRAINQAAMEEHTAVLNEKLDASNAKLAATGKPIKPRKLLPGVKVFNAVKLSVTKV